MKKIEQNIEGNKILILGTSNPQLDSIIYCQKRGLEVHACGHKKIGRGVKVADKFSIIDIKNKKEVLDYCEKNNIDYIHSVGSEMALPTVNYVSKELGLPYFLEPEVTDLSKDKTILRNRLGDDFLGNVDYMGIRNKHELSSWKSFPAVIKPTDGQGQRGVRKIDNVSEAKKYFDEVMSYSNKKKIIIEDYVDGPEISVNAFVIDGSLIFFQDSDRISFQEYPGGIIKEHHIPSKYSAEDEELKRILQMMTQEAVDRLSIKNGPVYIQLKLKDKKNPKLIEFTPRLDGCHIWRLIKYYSEADVLDATFQLLFGKKENALKALNEVDKDGKYFLEFMTEKPDNIVNKDKYNLDDALFVDWYYDQGEKVREVNGFVERVGYKIIKN